MSIEDNAQKLSEKVAKMIAGGTLVPRPTVDTEPQVKIESESIKLYAFARAMGGMEKVIPESREVSADKKSAKINGAQFQRMTYGELHFAAQFGNADLSGYYDLGKLKIPDGVDDPAKFAEKVEKVILKGLQKNYIID